MPAQMRDALTRLREDFGCRIFVIALGDARQIYSGGKVGAWAATLDELARELDAVIVVSAGNRQPRLRKPRLGAGGNRSIRIICWRPATDCASRRVPPT